MRLLGDLEGGDFDGFVDGGEFEDFEFTLAVGGDHGGGVSDFFAEEGSANGGGGGDEALGDVGFFAGDELVGDVLFLGGVEDDDGGAKADFVAGDVVEVDHGELAHALFELAEAGVDELLALFGGVILGVFGEIAEGDGFLDLGGEFGGELVFEGFDLLFEGFFDVFHAWVCFAGHAVSRQGRGVKSRLYEMVDEEFGYEASGSGRRVGLEAERKLWRRRVAATWSMMSVRSRRVERALEPEAKRGKLPEASRRAWAS